MVDPLKVLARVVPFRGVIKVLMMILSFRVRAITPPESQEIFSFSFYFRLLFFFSHCFLLSSLFV